MVKQRKQLISQPKSPQEVVHNTHRMTCSETESEIRGSSSGQEKFATNQVDQDKQVTV